MKGPLYPPVYFLIALIIQAWPARIWPLANLLPEPYTYGGAILIAIGVAIAISASRMFDRLGTTVKPFEESAHLATAGLYRVTRNPMYLGMVFVLAGVALLLSSLTALLLVPPFMLLLFWRFIRVEEQMLEERFGDEYRELKARVRRWI